MHTRRNRLLAAAAVAAIISTAMVFLLRQRDNPAPAAAPAPAPSANPQAERAHEMSSLDAELKKKPGHPPILFRMAQLARDAGKPEEAAGHLKQILAAEPKNAEAQLELGRLLFETGDVEGSIRETNRLLEQDPKQVDALYNLGAIYGNLNDDARARQYWERAVAAAPDSDSGRKARDGLAKLRPR